MILVPYARWEIETSLSPPALAERAREFLADEPPAEVHPDITDVLERGGAHQRSVVRAVTKAEGTARAKWVARLRGRDGSWAPAGSLRREADRLLPGCERPLRCHRTSA